MESHDLWIFFFYPLDNIYICIIDKLISSLNSLNQFDLGLSQNYDLGLSHSFSHRTEH